jgi:hypothetical protein
MKICADCRHSVAPDAFLEPSEHTRCNFTYPGEVDLVTGMPKKQQFRYCNSLRESLSDRNCGPGARFFEAIVKVPAP